MGSRTGSQELDMEDALHNYLRDNLISHSAFIS